MDAGSPGFEGFQWRDIMQYGLNWVKLQNYDDASPPDDIWCDDVVVATAYIGPITPAGSQRTLTTSSAPAGSGSVTPAGNSQHDVGVVVNVTATPSGSNLFLYWSGDSVELTPSIDVTMDGDRSVTAHFGLPGDDADADGYSNGDELAAGTHPGDVDSDDDGMIDGWEAQYQDPGPPSSLDPTRNDSDGDGTLDGLEDADGDGYSNLQEYAGGSDPTDPTSVPPPPPASTGGGGVSCAASGAGAAGVLLLVFAVVALRMGRADAEKTLTGTQNGRRD
jgi:hypothetical protein